MQETCAAEGTTLAADLPTAAGSPQVAFDVKQNQPKTLDDAVAATIEMESYTSVFPNDVHAL